MGAGAQELESPSAALLVQNQGAVSQVELLGQESVPTSDANIAGRELAFYATVSTPNK